MQLLHICPECGESDYAKVHITVFLWPNREPQRLIFTFTCLHCDHQWQMETDDFDIDESP
jgi:hypothetical protein